MIRQKKIAVLYHLFYEDTIENIVQDLQLLNYFETTFFFNISSDTPGQIEIRERLLQNFPGSIISISSNKGKDIGAKLVLLNLCIEAAITPDWFVFLHDKKSLQALNAKTWKEELFKIIREPGIKTIDGIISESSSAGIIAAEKYVIEEIRQNGKFTGTNGARLDQLVTEYEISCKTFDYVAGTMFWAKAHVLLDFFKKHNPLKIRSTLESGNVLDNFEGSNTHSWERMLSWIILSKGLTIKKI